MSAPQPNVADSESSRPGPLIIISGPSGTGKSTLVQRLLESAARGSRQLRLSVSATTRLPRVGEQDGVHYHFWTREQFEREVRAGAFLEHAEVHGRYYGTLVREVEPFRNKGQGVILDIDVQGAAQVRSRCPDAVSIFLRTRSWETYEQRLRKRATEDEAAVQRRLAAAAGELARAGEYDYQVLNDDLEYAVAEVRAVVERAFERGTNAG